MNCYNGHKEEILYNESAETLEQAAQRGCGCPLPGSVPGHVGWGFEQPDLVKDVSVSGRGARLDDLKVTGHFGVTHSG